MSIISECAATVAQLANKVLILSDENDRLREALLQAYAEQWAHLSGRSVAEERANLDEARILSEVLGAQYWRAA